MESIGERLRLARERGTYTLEQISRDTHVAKRFLKALEDEDFTVFPGETYAMGFLRTYGEYLGLDPDELVAAYRNIKIQEQPLPMTELLDTRRRIKPRVLIIAAAAAVVVIAVAAIVLYRVLGSRGADAGPAHLGARTAAEEFAFEAEVRTRWFLQGDTIVVPLGAARYRVEVAQVGDTLTLKVPGGTADLALGRERLIDLDGDSSPDLRVVWNDVDRSSAERRVNLGLYRVTGAAGSTTPSATGAAASTAPATGAAAAAGGATAATGTTATAGQTASTGGASTGTATGGTASTAATARPSSFKTVQVATAAATSTFTVDFLFRGDCLFRYVLDGGDSDERFFQRDEQFSLEATSRMTLWLSNAGAVRATVEGKQVDLGRAGEVGTRAIAWRNDTASSGYVLEIEPLF